MIKLNITCDIKESLGRNRRRWENNIKMNDEETERLDVDYIYLVQHRHQCV